MTEAEQQVLWDVFEYHASRSRMTEVEWPSSSQRDKWSPLCRRLATLLRAHSIDHPDVDEVLGK